jgi:hypothetical protein
MSTSNRSACAILMRSWLTGTSSRPWSPPIWTKDAPSRGGGSSATGLRDGLRGIGVEIRAGLHSGEVQFRGADVGGIAVHIAARVMAAAGAGEVLVSGTVHDLVAGSDDVLEDRGAHTLRGMTGQWRLFAVRRRGYRWPALTAVTIAWSAWARSWAEGACSGSISHCAITPESSAR